MYLLYILLLFFPINSIKAENFGESTNLKIPRFVSTKSNESNIRIGAGFDYPKILTYTLKNMPLEVIDEEGVWRQIKDIDDNQGWIHESLIKGNRYGIIKTSHNQPAQIMNKPEGKIIGEIGNRNIVKIYKCFGSWCHIKFKKYKGWINKINIWGVYKDEKFNIPLYQFIINIYWKII